MKKYFAMLMPYGIYVAYKNKLQNLHGDDEWKQKISLPFSPKEKKKGLNSPDPDVNSH